MKFTEEDFSFGPSGDWKKRELETMAANQAQAKLDAWLANAPVLEHQCRSVYYCSHHDWYTSERSKPTHRARLLDFKKVKNEPGPK
jgi:hypothetical protein